MADLTQRQTKILKNIVEEFIETAAPVGSETLEKKYSLGVSSATIRNEMSTLVQLGFLKKDHSSSGRTPTSMGLKFYVRNLMQPKPLSVSEEIKTKQQVWDFRNQFDKLLMETTKELAKKSRNLALATTDQNSIYNYGASNLLEEPEFFNIDVTKTILSLIDNCDYWFDLINKVSPDTAASDQTTIHLLIGEDLGLEHLEPCGFIYQNYQSGPHQGILGIVGPARFNFSYVIPLVNHFAQLISQISG